MNYLHERTIEAIMERLTHEGPRTMTVTASTRFEIDEKGGIWLRDGSWSTRIGYASRPVVLPQETT